MKKFLTVLSLLSVMLTATSCMRGGNIDKGNDGYIGNRNAEAIVTTDYNSNIADTDMIDNYDEHEGKIRNIPSKIRDNIDSGIDDIMPDRIDGNTKRDIK